MRLRLLKLGNVDRVRKKLLFMPSKTDWKMKLLKVLLHPRLQEFLASRAADPDMKSPIVPHCLERESARIRQDQGDWLNQPLFKELQRFLSLG